MPWDPGPTVAYDDAQDSEEDAPVRHARGTPEWRILNNNLGSPALRIRKAGSTRPSARELIVRALEFYGKPVPRPISKGSSSSSFPYSKLGRGRVRILRLYSSKHPDEQLKADIFQRKLEDVEGQYEAMSYCWGTEPPTHEIQIRDLNAATVPVGSGGGHARYLGIDPVRMVVGAFTHTRFEIRKNLFDALRRIRSKHHDVYLWVDAICIDQSEKGTVEKEDQIALMPRIYASAAATCVWLGEEHRDIARSAFALARDVVTRGSFDDVMHDPNNKVAWGHFVAIMRSQWFTRRWVIQEIAHSRSAVIHCGDEVLHWDDFVDAVSLLTEKIETAKVGLREDVFDNVETAGAAILIQTLHNTFRKVQDDGPISSRLLDTETLVSAFLSFHASFPSDTIYAVLSLAKDFPNPSEDWQNTHREQIDKDRDSKLERLKAELDGLGARRRVLEDDLIAAERDRREIKNSLNLIEIKKRQLEEARQQGRHDDADRLSREIRPMREAQLLAMNQELQDADTDLNRCIVQTQQLILKYRKIEKETKVARNISLLPNYRCTPRDLFIAFVTRTICRTGSLDIICRHWAPDVPGPIPSWVSRRSKAPFGLPGTACGRQNGENLVALFAHDQRRRYAASGTAILATIKMLLDPMITEGENFTQPTNVRNEVAATVAEEGPEEMGALNGEPRRFDSVAADALRENGEAETEDAVPEPANSIHHHRSTVVRLRAFGHLLSSRVTPEPTAAPFAEPARPPTLETAEVRVEDASSPSVAARADASPSLLPPGILRPNLPLRLSLPSAQSWSPNPYRLSGILVVRGFILGVIKSRSDAMRGGIIPGAWVRKLGWETNQKGEVPDTLWRLLVADRTSQGARPPRWYKRACMHGLRDLRISDNVGNIHPPTRDTFKLLPELPALYFERVKSVVWNRCILEIAPARGERHTPSEAGESFDVFYGLGPEGCEVGDIVCILYGCSVPAVLKRAQRPRVDGLYEVVGEAYVHGIMDGELMESGSWATMAKEFRLG